MNWHYIEKEYYDYADDIEGVNIHYVWTLLESEADWENQRVTRFMPHVQSSPPMRESSLSLIVGNIVTSLPRLRKKILKLPQQIFDPANNTFTSRYLLHHYFEVFQDGHRHYSPLYTEEIHTDAPITTAMPHRSEQKRPSYPIPTSETIVKK